ncbi:MAG: GNAT family N-acetyltransferase, partial [Gaiellaceae bacterium]
VVFVARKGPRTAGYVALRRDVDNAIVVEQVLIAPGHERQGIGHRLLTYVEGFAIAERAPVLRMIVEESNLSARSFYRRRGFISVGREELELVLPEHV